MNWTDRYTYNYPTKIRFGKGVIQELPGHLKDQGFKKPLLVSDPGLASLPLYAQTVSLFEKAGLSVTSFNEIHKNPVKSDVVKGVESYNSSDCDCIVGMGGGASMDVARAIALWVNHPKHDLFDFDDAKGGDRFVVNAIPYFITVPTTSGTGSEVGRSTVISDDQSHAKKILFAPSLLARMVFADPELSMGVPAFVTAATGIDALTHNLEALIAKGVHPMAEGIAMEGTRLIFESLVEATDKSTLESRAKMQMAALMGAVAFQKGLGVVHSLAHPLSTVFDMHHGLANAIMLSHGMEFNRKVSEEKFTRLQSLCHLPGKGGQDFVKYLRDFNTQIKMPNTLKDNVSSWDEKALDRLVDLAIEDPCHQCNPRPVTRQDFKQLYEGAYHA